MKFIELVRPSKLNSTVVFGYYGGGNFGDELLLSVLLAVMHKNDVQDVVYYYSNATMHKRMHASEPYEPVRSSGGLLRRILSARNIVLGGGGHWGLDMNSGVFKLTVALFLYRYILRRNIYLIGVGFYGSTNIAGRISAFLVAKASTEILARDKESFRNFSRYSKNVSLDKDIAYYMDMSTLQQFEAEAVELCNDLQLDNGEKYTLITLRHFQEKYKNNYQKLIREIIKEKRGDHIILMLLEPREVDTAGYSQLVSLRREYPLLRIVDNQRSPLSFVAFCQKYHSQLRMVAPQYHGQLVADLFDIPHMPIVYDNKVKELLRDQGIGTTIDIHDLRLSDIRKFIDED